LRLRNPASSPDAGLEGKHESAREHNMHALRHFPVSVLSDAGESVQAVSQNLGDTDPTLTLHVYALPSASSQARTRRAVDVVVQHARWILMDRLRGCSKR